VQRWLTLLIGMVEVEDDRARRAVGQLSDGAFASKRPLAYHLGQELHLAGARVRMKRQAEVLDRSGLLFGRSMLVIVIVVVVVALLVFLEALVVIVVIVVKVAREQSLRPTPRI